jgi:hypothetical protein
MGTRHLICVYLNNNCKVANYGQWDGYPGGQGLDCLKFLRSKSFNKEKFIENLNLIVEPSEKDVEADFIMCGMNPGDEYVSMDVSKKFHDLHSHMSRDNGAKILEMIQNETNKFWLRKI